MVRSDIVARKIARASARLDDAERLLSRSREDFVSDTPGRDLAAFYLFLAIQECIDLAAHWISDCGWPPPDDSSSSFDVLADRGVIENEVAGVLRGAAGLRNRIAHGYALLDRGRLYDEANEDLGLIRRYLAALTEAAGI